MTGKFRLRLASTAVIALLALLPSCKPEDSPLASIDSMAGRHAETEARLSTQASVLMAQGKTDEALARYEKLYEHNRRDEIIAVNYAQVLRKTGSAGRAAEVLAPFTGDDELHALALNEYAADEIALGNFDTAKTSLKRVLAEKDAEKFHNDAHALMGVALDAQGMHKDAEKMFRAALDGWKGDPTSVMNNLGLCLAAEGNFDEALTLLRKALVMAPDKHEIAHNIEIVEQLRGAVVRKPATKKKS